MIHSIIFGLALFFSLLSTIRTINIAVKLSNGEYSDKVIGHWFQVLITCILWTIYHYMS